MIKVKFKLPKPITRSIKMQMVKSFLILYCIL